MEFSNVDSSAICPIFSPCSKYFATIQNQCINIKDASYLDLKDYSKILIKQKNNITPMIKFSPDSHLIAVKFLKKVEVYDIQGNLKIRILQENYQIQNIIWSQDLSSYQLLVFYKNLNNCQIYNLKDGSISIIKCTKFSNQNGCTFSKGIGQGKFMAILQRNGMKDSIGIYFTRTWQLVNYINLQTCSDIGRIQFTQNGNILAIEKMMNFKVYIIDMYRGIIEEYGDKNYVLGFCCHKFSNSSQFLALGAHDNCIHLLNTTTWKLIIEIEMTNELDLSKTQWLKEQANGFYPAQGSKGKVQKKEQQQGDTPPSISILEFSPNDQFLAVKIDTMSNSIFIYRIRDLELITVISLMKNVKDFKWIETQNGQVNLCIVYGSSSLLFWRDSNDQDNIYEIVVPTATNSDFKIGKIEQGQNQQFIFYSVMMKKFVYASL